MVDAAGTVEVDEEILRTETDDGPMSVLLKQPAGSGAWPTVAVFHDGPGIREATHEFTRRLASAGFRVVVPDLYHRHGDMIGFGPEEMAADPELEAKMPELRQQVRSMLQSLTDDGIQRDLDAALGAIGATDSPSLGCLGFCLGARAIFRTMMRLPDQFIAGATWHPSFLADDGDDSPHLTAGNLTGDVYIGIGTADQMQSIEMHQPFFDAVAPLANVEVEIFDGADHGYSWPAAPTYHELAATGSWDKTLALFERKLVDG